MKHKKDRGLQHTANWDELSLLMTRTRLINIWRHSTVGIFFPFELCFIRWTDSKSSSGSDCVKIRNYRAAPVCLVLLCVCSDCIHSAVSTSTQRAKTKTPKYQTSQDFTPQITVNPLQIINWSHWRKSMQMQIPLQPSTDVTIWGSSNFKSFQQHLLSKWTSHWWLYKHANCDNDCALSHAF